MMKIYLLLFTVVWSRMSDGYIHSSICANGENGLLIKDQERCESCSCENISTNDNCTLEFCPCLKMLCSQSSDFKDFTRKVQVDSKSDSDVKMKKYWSEDHYDTDKRGRNEIVHDENINPDFMMPMDKRHKRNTEQEREQNNPILERYFGMNQLIRLMSIDYPMPVTQSDSDSSGVLVMLLYSAIVVIGITICIIVYRKYGHSTNHGDLERENQQAATITKSLLYEDPPPYEECVV